jgi:ADP-heptose:LPS heptosyltransferase
LILGPILHVVDPSRPHLWPSMRGRRAACIIFTMSNSARAILAVDVSAFGQALMLVPTMKALRAALPKTFLAAAAPTGVCELLAGCGLVDEAIELGVIKADGAAYASALGRLGKLINRTRRHEFDLVLDLSPKVETQILSRAFLRARTLTPSRLPHLFDALLARAQGPSRADHAADCASVLKQLGLKLPDARLGLTLPTEENERFEQLLHRHGSRGGEPIVVLYSSRVAAPRGWSAESFGELATRLAGNFGARVVAADEPSDDGFTDCVGRLLPNGAIKVARPRAIELAAAIARASVVVTDDAGIVRLALDLGTPALEISGQPPRPCLSKSHRVIHGSSAAGVSTDEVYEVACVMLQESRTESLFHQHT